MESIQQALLEINWGVASLLFLLGIISFTISTVSGGGGALILVPLLNWLLGVNNTAPVINLGTLIGRPSRLILFWKNIDWNVCAYYIPSAIAGALLGSFLFANINIGWLQIFVGLFLISTVFQYRFGKKARSFTMKLWYFIPLGFIISILSTLIGGMGPVLNPFYLNLGLDKEDLIGTKTANSFFMGLSQIGSYAVFGLLVYPYWVYGITLGLGATIGNIIGKRFLKKMSSQTFRQLLIILMVISGILLIYRQL